MISTKIPLTKTLRNCAERVLSIFQALHTVFYIVKDDLVSHLLKKLCSTNHSGFRLLVSLVIPKRLKLQKPDCAHLKDFLM